MTEARSKRRVLPLIFIVKSFKKPLLIRVSVLRIKNNSKIRGKCEAGVFEPNSESMKAKLF